ncbi:hypothetical protein HanPSC8_Chr03g0088291 [Helianthus annuus]|nr:hypothetical protein HanPSC8_Chr03g0088291 [Helianthus annuus]
MSLRQSFQWGQVSNGQRVGGRRNGQVRAPNNGRVSQTGGRGGGSVSHPEISELA